MNRRRFAILGLGQFGRNLSRELSRLGHDVLAVDVSSKKVESIRNEVAVAAMADIRDRHALAELFTGPFDVVIIAIGGSLEAAIMATLHLKELGVKEVWAEANTDERAEVLRRVGATRVLSPERDMGRRLAQSLANPNLIEFLPLTEGYGVVDVPAPSWSHGKTLAELALRNRFNVAVIAIRSGQESTQIVPGGGAKLGAGDVLTLVGRDAELAHFHEGK